MADDPKEMMRESFLEAPTLREWVEARYTHRFEDWADRGSMRGDDLWMQGYALDFNWQREELYFGYTVEVWRWLDEWATAVSPDYYALDALVERGFSPYMETHEDFIDVVVTLALAQIASTVRSGT